MSEKFSNLYGNVVSSTPVTTLIPSVTLADAYTAGDGQITVSSATGAPTSGTFSLTIFNAETGAVYLIFRVTSVAGTVFTGAAEGTDANAPGGAAVAGTMLTAAALGQIQTDFLAAAITAIVPLAEAATISEINAGGHLINAALPATAVTPGSYTNTNLTVNQEGVITTASNGSGGGGGSQVDFVQSEVLFTDGNVSSSTVTLPNAVQAGDLIVVCMSWQGGSAVPTAVTDSLGTTYALIASVISAEAGAMYAGVAAGAGANTITITWSAGTQYIDVCVGEFSNCTATADTSATASNPSEFNAVSATSTTDGDLLVFMMGGSAGGTAGYAGCIPMHWKVTNGSTGQTVAFKNQPKAGLFSNGAFFSAGQNPVIIAAFKA